MLYILWFLSLVVSFGLGYFFRRINQRIDTLEDIVKEKAKKPEEPQSEVIDPLDPIQTAVYEHEKMMRELNE